MPPESDFLQETQAKLAPYYDVLKSRLHRRGRHHTAITAVSYEQAHGAEAANDLGIEGGMLSDFDPAYYLEPAQIHKALANHDLAMLSAEQALDEGVDDHMLDLLKHKALDEWGYDANLQSLHARNMALFKTRSGALLVGGKVRCGLDSNGYYVPDLGHNAVEQLAETACANAAAWEIDPQSARTGDRLLPENNPNSPFTALAHMVHPDRDPPEPDAAR